MNDALSEAGWQVLNPILHRELHMLARHPNATSLAAYYAGSLEQCGCSPSFRPATFFAYALGADTVNLAGAPLDEGLRAWVHDTLARRLRRRQSVPDRMALVTTHGDLRSADLFAYGLMPTYKGDTIVYGFTFARERLAPIFADAFRHNGILPRAVTRGLPNDSILAVRVATPAGAVLFTSSTDADWNRGASDTVRAAAAGLVVTAAVRQTLSGLVLGGGRPQSLLLLALMTIAAALTVVAVRQLRREEELVRLRTDFVSSVSHELRTPLAQVRLFLETLRLGRFTTEEQREWLLGHLDRETTRLTHLVENVLHFSRGTHSTTPVPLEPTDLAGEIGETVRAFAPLALSRQATVAVRASDGLIVPLDRAGFRQMLLNVLDNALKYGPAGQTIVVDAHPQGGMARVTISDEGPGIDTTEPQRVWEAYYRGRDSAVRAVGGSGIGLAVVREAVERHGGTARIEAAAGGGTAVVLELPMLATPSAITAA